MHSADHRSRLRLLVIQALVFSLFATLFGEGWRTAGVFAMLEDDHLNVLHVAPGSPADRAGLKKGDKLIATIEKLGKVPVVTADVECFAADDIFCNYISEAARIAAAHGVQILFQELPHLAATLTDQGHDVHCGVAGHGDVAEQDALADAAAGEDADPLAAAARQQAIDDPHAGGEPLVGEDPHAGRVVDHGSLGASVATDDRGTVHTWEKLLLATGVVDHVPEIPGLREMYGRSVFHCPYCDGYEVRGKRLAVGEIAAACFASNVARMDTIIRAASGLRLPSSVATFPAGSMRSA